MSKNITERFVGRRTTLGMRHFARRDSALRESCTQGTRASWPHATSRVVRFSSRSSLSASASLRRMSVPHRRLRRRCRRLSFSKATRTPTPVGRTTHSPDVVSHHVATPLAPTATSVNRVDSPRPPSVLLPMSVSVDQFVRAHLLKGRGLLKPARHRTAHLSHVQPRRLTHVREPHITFCGVYYQTTEAKNGEQELRVDVQVIYLPTLRVQMPTDASSPLRDMERRHSRTLRAIRLRRAFAPSSVDAAHGHRPNEGFGIRGHVHGRFAVAEDQDREARESGVERHGR